MASALEEHSESGDFFATGTRDYSRVAAMTKCQRKAESHPGRIPTLHLLGRKRYKVKYTQAAARMATNR
jgi:hypothetical protein